MSRYYSIQVGQEVATQPGGQPPSGNPGVSWTNMVGGRVDRGALKVEMDIPVTRLAAPMGGASVTIWGVPLAQILPGAAGAVQQAQRFNGAPISVFGGMQPGLPLASAIASKRGLLVQGKVLQAFGNWMGVNQKLTFIIAVDGGATQSNPANIPFTWKKGTPLGAMIQQVLQQAFPGIPVSLRISQNLVLPADEPGTYQTLVQFAGYVNGVSQSIMPGGDYAGVDIALSGGQFIVSDGTQAFSTGASGAASDVIAIAFQDLIGQPTWLGPFKIQFTSVMRSDIQFDSYVTFPNLAAFQTQRGANANTFAPAAPFTGTWRVIMVRHIGDSRAPGAQSWVSTYQVVPAAGQPQADASPGDVGS